MVVPFIILESWFTHVMSFFTVAWEFYLSKVGIIGLYEPNSSIYLPGFHFHIYYNNVS